MNPLGNLKPEYKDLEAWNTPFKDAQQVAFYNQNDGNLYPAYLFHSPTNGQYYIGWWPSRRFTSDRIQSLIDDGYLPEYDSGSVYIEQDLGVYGNSYPPNWDDLHTFSEQSKSTEMDMNPTWDLVDAVLNHSRRVLLMGPPGTGKTYAATRRGLDGRKIQKVYSVTMTPETPMAELRGHFVPKDGEYVWMDGPAVRAWREGARLVINEIDHASPDTQSFMFALLDDPDFAETTLPTGETVRPASGFQVVATMNGVPDDLPPALQDRFPVTLEIQELNPEALAALPEDLQYAVRNTALHKSEERRISIRMWFEYANLRMSLRKEYGDTKGNELAAQAVFGERAEEALNALEMAKDLEAA